MNVRVIHYLVDGANLKAALKRMAMGKVDYITGSREGWTVHLRDAKDLPACTLTSWVGLPVKYEALTHAAA
jgi:hypothetical protein